MPRTNEMEGMMSGLNEAVARLERAYVAGLDEEFRDDVRTVLDALSAQTDAVGGRDVLPTDAMVNAAEDIAYASMPWHGPDEMREGVYEMVRAALAARQPVGVEPVAWMTHHDEPMLYPTFTEAAAYCEDDEPPIPLYTTPPAAVPVDALRDAERYRVLRMVDAVGSAIGSEWECGDGTRYADEYRDADVDAFLALATHPQPAAASVYNEGEGEWMELAMAGKEAAACKAYRAMHGTSLREAYDAVKRWILQQAKPEVQ